MTEQRFFIAAISIFVLGSLYLAAHAETSGSIAVNITYTNGDRADYWPISMKIYQDNNVHPYREISSITGNPFNILSLPLGHQYKIEVYANDMHATVRYVDLEQPQQNLDLTIPLSGGMRINVLYNDKVTPIQNAAVEVGSNHNKTWASGITDAKGQTLRFWLSPTTNQSDYYVANIKVGKTLQYSHFPIFLSPGIPQEVNVVTSWPPIVNSLITVKLYNSQSSVLSNRSGTITVDLLDTNGNLVSQSPANTRGDAYFYNLKVGDYVLHVNDMDNSRWTDSNVTIDGTKFSFNMVKNLNNATASESSSTKQPVINCNCVAFMLDNVQDYWLNNVQTGILDAFKQKDASLTLGIISNAFGNDSKLTGSIKDQVNSDNKLIDVGINGWNFEDFTLYDKDAQVLLLEQSKSKISSTLGVMPTIFVPPYGKINQDTFSAMQTSGLYYVTTDVIPPMALSGQVHGIPVTVFESYYHLKNGTLQQITNDMIISKIQNSIQNHGFAVVTLNFQDYAAENGTLKINSPDLPQIEKLESLIDMIRDSGIRIVKISKIENQTGDMSESLQSEKASAKSWSQNTVSNSEFLKTIQFMLKHNVIKSATPNAELKNIPYWLKHVATLWSSDQISDQEFANTIEYLIETKTIN